METLLEHPPATDVAPAPPHDHAEVLTDTPTDARRWWALAFVVLGLMWISAQLIVMNIALPTVQADLGLSDTERRWVVTAYAICFGGLILLGGKVSDLVGRKRGVLVGLLGFAAASALAAAAPNGTTLLAARALQGVFAALASPSALALLSVTFSRGEERGKAFGVLGAAMGVGGAFGLIVGGALTGAFSWRWCVAISVPIVLVAAAGIAATTTPDRPTTKPKLDVPGAALVTAAVTSIVVGFDRASADGWAAGSTLAVLATGGLLLATFLAWQRRVAEPVLRLGIVWHRVRGTAYLAVFAMGVGVFAVFFFLTFYLQSVRGYTPLRTGFAFVPSGLAGVLVAPLLSRLVTRVAPRHLLGAGLLAVAGALVLLTQLDPDSGYLTGVLPAFLLMGVGGPAVMVTATSTATIDAGADTGVAGAAVGAHQQIGAALGTALLGSIATSATAARLTAEPGGRVAELAATVHGYNVAAAWGAAFVLAGAVAVHLVARRASDD